MTPGDVREELFTRLGGTVEPLEMERIRVTWRGESIETSWYEDYLDSVGVPDWPEDTAAALNLCSDLAQKHDWTLMLDWTHWPKEGETAAAFADIWYDDNTQRHPLCYEIQVRKGAELEACGKSKADALARLALAALRGQEADR